MRRANNQVDKQRQGVGRFREAEKASKAVAKPELGNNAHCPSKDTASQGPSITGQVGLLNGSTPGSLWGPDLKGESGCG